MDKMAKFKKGMSLMEAGKFAEAERIFTTLLSMEEHHSIRNNIGICRYRQGKYFAALEILKPALKKAFPNTVAKCTAVDCCLALDKPDQAKMYMQQAVADFEEMGRNKASELGLWSTYSGMVFRTLGRLDQVEDICKLYQRSHFRGLPDEAIWLSGVAYFNLGRYKKAASVWQKPFSKFKLVAEMVEQGIVPPFELEYIEPYSSIDPKDMGASLALGVAKLILLTDVLQRKEGEEPEETAAWNLVYFTGQWGLDLATGLLESPLIHEEEKYAVINALIRRGVLDEGDSVNVWLDGGLQSILIEGNDELDYEKAIDSAYDLAREGRAGEAIDLLQSLPTGEFEPRYHMCIVQLLLSEGRKDEALKHLTLLKEHCSDASVTHYFDALYQFHKHRFAESEKALNRMKGKFGYSDLKEMADSLRAIVVLGHGMRGIANSLIKMPDIDKELPVSPSVKRGFRNMPVEALHLACEYWQLPGEKLRDAVQTRLVEYISDAGSFAKAWKSLKLEERDVLSYLMSKGGWVRISAVTKKFGPVWEDGKGLDAMPPNLLGRLWVMGLVFAGTAKIEGRRYKIVAVPVEVRKFIQSMV